ncbi:hypothetical protein [Streptomyces sp. LMG1-1-1.1]|uniref:hypothetical protein n=1 Tax=Streptomyces sp. LMG1-1-1.1 TaxID=3135245 RepID=UPI0034671BDA
MPEFYSSIGEAIGATMQHNIRLAHRSVAPGSDKPPRVRHLPSASADPYSIPGTIARLTADATPKEVFETWTRLAAAHVMLQDVQEQLAAAEDGIAACPAERTDPRYHERVNVLRTRELLDDVLGTGPVAAEPPAPRSGRRPPPCRPCFHATDRPPTTVVAARRRRGPGAHPTAPLSRRALHGQPVDTYGTDVAIFPWADDLVWADCRTGLPESAHRILRSWGFAAPGDPGDPASYSLASHLVGPDRQLASSSAASMLADLGYCVAIDPSLAVGYVGEAVEPEARRLAAARQVSPVAAESNTGTSAPPSTVPPPSAVHPVPRSR